MRSGFLLKLGRRTPSPSAQEMLGVGIDQPQTKLGTLALRASESLFRVEFPATCELRTESLST